MVCILHLSKLAEGLGAAYYNPRQVGSLVIVFSINILHFIFRISVFFQPSALGFISPDLSVFPFSTCFGVWKFPIFTAVTSNLVSCILCLVGTFYSHGLWLISRI